MLLTSYDFTRSQSKDTISRPLSQLIYPLILLYTISTVYLLTPHAFGTQEDFSHLFRYTTCTHASSDTHDLHVSRCLELLLTPQGPLEYSERLFCHQ